MKVLSTTTRIKTRWRKEQNRNSRYETIVHYNEDYDIVNIFCFGFYTKYEPIVHYNKD